MHCGNGFNGNCVPDISCMHINICSLPDKFDKLKVLLSSLELVNIRFDFILICETFLSDRNHDLYNLPGYTFVSRHRKYAKCGGVGIYVRSCFNYIVREDLSTFKEQSFESIFIEVAERTGHNVLIGEIYRIPNTSCADSINNYTNILTKLQRENKDIIIGTDKNVDYLITTCVYSKHLLQTFLFAGLLPTITRPTRVTHTAATLIDNLYIQNSQFEKVFSGILTVDISDHFPIFIFIGNRRTKRHQTVTFQCRRVTADSIVNIKRLLNMTDWNILLPLSVDEQFELFHRKLNEYINICSPIKTITLRPKHAIREKWMTKGLLCSSQTLHKLRRKMTGKFNDDNISRKYSGGRTETLIVLSTSLPVLVADFGRREGC